MKRSFLAYILFLFCPCGLWAQQIDNENGKTYYYHNDSIKNVKEIFHHVRVMRYGMRNGEKYDTMVHIKHGPYTSYHENGKLHSSGYYHYDKKDSIWKYYDSSGTSIGVKRYRKGDELP